MKRSDDSNPQQGSTPTTTTSATSATSATTGSSATTGNSATDKVPTECTTFKIPPTKKDNRKLFVGGLPPEVTDVEFKAFFEKFGSILDSVVMIDRETKCSRGFGFVTFHDPAVADRIIKENMQDDTKSKVNINGKWCEVKASEPKRGYHSGRSGEGGRGRSLASTPATSSRNSSIETSSREESTRPTTVDVRIETNNTAPQGLSAPPQGYQSNYYYNYYNRNTATPYHQPMVGQMPAQMPYYPVQMNMAQPNPYYHYAPAPMMTYNNDNMAMYPSQYGNYGNMYQYPPVPVSPQTSDAYAYEDYPIDPQQQMMQNEE